LIQPYGKKSENILEDPRKTHSFVSEWDEQEYIELLKESCYLLIKNGDSGAVTQIMKKAKDAYSGAPVERKQQIDALSIGKLEKSQAKYKENKTKQSKANTKKQTKTKQSKTKPTKQNEY
jgi:hypothetical protein